MSDGYPVRKLCKGNYVLWDTNIEFGVHTSYQSDYDILVVVTGPTKHVEEKLYRITNKYHDLFADRRHAFPQFIVEHINTVNRNLKSASISLRI